MSVAVPGAASHAVSWPPRQYPCGFCGQLIHLGSDTCGLCGMSQSPAVRARAAEISGDWYILEAPRRLSRGMNVQVLLGQVRKKLMVPTSIVKGPTTRGEWTFAGRAPGLAKHVGVCHFCDKPIIPGSHACTNCGRPLEDVIDPPTVLPSDSMAPLAPLDGKTVCVFCGNVMPPTADMCNFCNSPTAEAIRRTSQELSGEWYVLAVPDKLSRGVNLNVIFRKIEQRQITAATVIKSPTTGGEWRFAGRTPGLAALFGMCHVCGRPVAPHMRDCAACRFPVIRLSPPPMPPAQPPAPPPMPVMHATPVVQASPVVTAMPVPSHAARREDTSFPSLETLNAAAAVVPGLNPGMARASVVPAATATPVVTAVPVLTAPPPPMVEEPPSPPRVERPVSLTTEIRVASAAAEGSKAGPQENTLDNIGKAGGGAAQVRHIAAAMGGGGVPAGMVAAAGFGALVIGLGLGFVMFSGGAGGGPSAKPGGSNITQNPNPKPDPGVGPGPGIRPNPGKDGREKDWTGGPFPDPKTDPARPQRLNEVKAVIAKAEREFSSGNYLEAVNQYAQAAMIYPREFPDAVNPREVQQKFVGALNAFEAKLRRDFQTAAVDPSSKKGSTKKTDGPPEKIGPDPAQVAEAGRLIARGDQMLASADPQGAAAAYADAMTRYPGAIPPNVDIRRKFDAALERLHAALPKIDVKGSKDVLKSEANQLRQRAYRELDGEKIEEARRTFMLLVQTGYFTAEDTRRLVELQAKWEKRAGGKTIFDN